MKIKVPCSNCAHEEICNVKCYVEKMRAILSEQSFAFDSAESDNFSIKIDCKHFLQVKDEKTLNNFSNDNVPKFLNSSEFDFGNISTKLAGK